MESPTIATIALELKQQLITPQPIRQEWTEPIVDPVPVFEVEEQCPLLVNPDPWEMTDEGRIIDTIG